MISAPYVATPAGGIHVFDAATLPWQDTPEAGLKLKPVRYDDERGHFLGLVWFAPMARSGLHQHQGVATSFIIDGGLTDFQGPVKLYEAGINLAGATHDAIAYANTVLVSRLEAPVTYPHDRVQLTGLHAGSRHAEVANHAPDVLPDINVAVDALPCLQTGVPGLLRQTIFDYAGTGSDHRFVQLHLRPGVVCPPWRPGALTELWVRGGSIRVDGREVHANSFVLIEAGATVEMASPHGALLLAWAEGREQWLDAAASAAPPRSLFGF